MYEFLPRSDDINQRFMTWHHPIFFSETEVWKSMTREEKAASPIDGGSRSISWKSSKKAAILRYGRLLDPLFKRILNVKGIFFHWLKTGGTITQTHRLKGTKRYQEVRKGTELFKMVQNGTKWYTMVHNGTRWYTTVHNSILKSLSPIYHSLVSLHSL